MRIVAPWGFYGMGNIGDEGTLCGFARLLALNDVTVPVGIASSNPAHTSRVEPSFQYFNAAGPDPRRWWAKLRGTAHAVVGGTAVMDVLGDWPLRDIVPLVRAGEKWKVPFIFVGCGVENLRLSQSRSIVAEELAPRVLHWSVRSDRDRERLVSYGVPARAVTTAADLAWLIEPVAQDLGRNRISQWGLGFERPLVAVNVANENLCFDRHPEMAAELASALDRLVSEQDMRVLFLCSEVREGPTFDQAAAHRIMGRMKRSDCAILAPNDYLSPRELMSVIGCCQLTISMRYHVCLFSALQGVPFVAIERADKVADLCWDLQWTARVKPPTFTAGELLEHAHQLLSVEKGTAAQLNQSVNTMKKRSLCNMATLHAIGVGRRPDGRS